MKNEKELQEENQALREQVLNWYNGCKHEHAKIVILLWDMYNAKQLNFNEPKQQIAISVPADETVACTKLINKLLESIRKTVVIDLSTKHNGIKYVLETLLTIQKIEVAGTQELTRQEKIKRDITLYQMEFSVFELQERIMKPVIL